MTMKHSLLTALLALVLLPLGALAAEVRGDVEAAAEGWERIEAGALILDVRSIEEYEGGHLDGAINIAHTDTQALASTIGEDKDRPVVLYCGSGRRAEAARDALAEQGYTNVFNASGLDALEATRPE